MELLTGFPLFPGEDEFDQIACIFEMFGVPSKQYLSTCKRERQFITSRGVPRYCVQSVDDRGAGLISGGYSKRGRFRGAPMSRDLVSALSSGGAKEAAADSVLVDFLRRCLEVNPDDRMSAADAIRHDWLKRRQQVAPPTTKPPTAAAGTTARSSRAQISVDSSHLSNLKR